MKHRVLWILLFSGVTQCLGWMDERPVLEAVNGNLIISSAKDKNVTIKTLGTGYLTVNDIDLLHSVRTANRAARLVESWMNGYMLDLQNRVQRLVLAVEGPNGLQKRIDTLWWGNEGTNSSNPHPTRPSTEGSGLDDVTKAAVRDLTGRVRRIESRIRTIVGKLRTNQCSSNPCQNGGTCIKIYDGFQCICPSNWQGPSCAIDVDECLMYAGTDLGCQNGATCINTLGSYRCACASGWFGIHCASKTSACSSQDSRELCGNGICVEQKGTPLGYTCICNQGWKSEGANPACSIDVDECAGNHPACSINPKVDCINIPGSFHCGSCPAGYTGSGHYCSDIDECLVDNGGCSTVPRVQCTNTLGSRICGSCPPGYQGDGVTCVFVGSCRMNNGGCHPLATCIESPGYTNINVLCRCPVGYDGNGMGPNGCLPSAQVSNACASNPCVHGTCSPHGQTFTCRCETGYTGATCANSMNPCLPNPCRNNGICTMISLITYTCECMAAYKGPRCETSKDECGGIIRDAAGSLSYPSNGGLYSNDKTCVWIFIANSSLVLNVTFTKFKLEDTPKCRHDFLQIHDGGYAGTHQIGRFCGHNLPQGGTFTSTHNSLYMWLNTDGSRVDEGFSLTWTSIAPVCGGTLTNDHGTISSPGSPGMYAVNRDCIWDIQVRPGKRIQFHFFTLMLEEHPTCSKDYVEINETISDRQIQLGIYCNHSHPEPLLTSGDSATVHFHSDDKGQDAGFQLSYSSIEGFPGCGGVYTTPQGTISSPREDEEYLPDMYCEWKIQLPIGEKIRLSWISMDIEDSGNCYYDYVEVYEGSDVESSKIGKYCGEALPPAQTLDTNVAIIIFRSDWSTQRKGFVLKYDTHCGGEFHEPSGTLMSPYYPNKYPLNKICNYEILQPPGKGIVLNIIDLDIEGHAYSECYFDFLRIYDGDNDNATQLAELCGGTDKIPDEPFYSTYNVMFLKFETDASYSNRGFLANYTTVDRRCGGLYKTPTGTIHSPLEDIHYANNEECVWTIQAPPGHVIQLKWNSFSLEDHDQCMTDWVSVKEEHDGLEQLIGTYCGTELPPTMTSQGRTMTITFMTDSTITSEGFAAEYLFIDSSNVCGGHYHSPHGFIRSPGWPDRYSNNEECVWIIEAPNKIQIKLDVQSFTLEYHPRCTFDYLEIRNGGHETSPLIGKYCGDEIPTSFQSMTNQLYLKFVSDSSRGLEGFNIEWESSTRGCGGTLSGTSGDIMSPYYPMSYSRSSDCIWTIAVAAGSRIQIFFVDLALEYNNRCRFDYLEIAEGANGILTNKKRFCGSEYPLSIDFETNLVTVHFRSDYTTSGRGFHIRYATLCQNKIHGYSGVIESPNFPNNYPPNANCTWIIDAPLGNKVNVTFSHFDLEGSIGDGEGSDCTYDFVEIKEGTKDEPNTELGKFCSTNDGTLPPKIASSQNQVFIHFRSDSSLHYGGFRLEWIVNGCGGHIKRPEGVLISPNYPLHYPKGTECEWLIEVDYGHSVQINFTDVDIEKANSCGLDKVELFGGVSAAAPKLTEFCYSKEAITFVSPVNKIFIKLTSNKDSSGRGFSAHFKAVPLTCGGVFKADRGFIQSANYPMNYPHNQNCEWLIEVDKHHVVNLTFIDIDLEHTANCTDDYVKVFDGATRGNEVLGSFCQRQTYPSIISSGNTVLVVMRTDSLITAKGFRAEFSRACGARIVTSDTGILTTASDLHIQHQGGHNCSWTIVAADAADHVTLSIVHMDLSCGKGACDKDCSSNVLEVHDGEDVAGPLRGAWCDTKVPPPIVSSGNALTVHLVTTEYTEAIFSARYSALNSACGGDYYSESGTLASPGYPDSYPLNAECVWTLQTSPGNWIQLIFSIFDIESSPNCDRDYLEIREKSSIGKLIGVFCGNQIESIETNEPLWMKFRSDDVGTGVGFVVEYSFKHGGELYGPSGVITSPLYPHPFTNTESVTWRVTVERGFAIKVEFDDFHVDGSFNDHSNIGGGLQFYDGYNTDAPLLHHIVGDWKHESFQSTSNIMCIVLGAQSRRIERWFKLHYYRVPKETKASNSVIELSPCNEEISLTEYGNLTQFITSPGYPNGYAGQLRCNWVITSAAGTHLVLQFLEIDLEDSYACISDSISVFSGFALSEPPPPEAKFLGKYCRMNESHVVVEATNVMTVKFNTDMFMNRTGFRALIRRACGGELSGPNGIIEFNETMTNRDTHSWDSKCEWNITVRPGRTIQVDILSMTIPETSNEVCTDHYVLLKNGRGPQSPLLEDGKYCSQDTDSLFTTGNALYVKGVGSRSLMTFKIAYREVGMECGGSVQLTQQMNSEQFSTPRYPNMPPPYSECFWTFMAPPGHRLSLHFVERFDLVSSPDCSKEYVEVRDGGTDASQLLGTFCTDTAPTSISSTGNMLYVHYYTEVTDPGNGFKALVTTGDLCGGIMRGKSGTITSQNYPASYPKDQQCVWWIIGPPDHSLKLEFRDLHLPGLRRCNQTDHVIIKEKLPDNETAEEIGTFCGSTKPGIIQTATNEALVIFHSDHRSFMSFRGFSLNFTASREACGGDLNDPEGSFHSLGYPNPTSRPIYCEWRIRGEEGSQVVLDILNVDTGTVLENKHGFYLAFFNDLQSKSRITVIHPGEYQERISSSSNTMLVSYWSASGRRGLNARYAVAAPAPCGGVVEDSEGSLVAPNTPPFINNSYYCSWTLKAPQNLTINDSEGSGVTLTVTITGLIGRNRRTRTCKYLSKYIMMMDEDSTVWAVCGNATQSPFILRSPSAINSIKVLNGTFGSIMNFDLKYRWSKCGGILNGILHTIQAPSTSFPKSCAWNVQYPEGQAIQMTFNRFNIGSCDKGYIIVRNGGPQSPELGKFCGNIKPRNITSSTDKLWIEYFAAEAPGDFEFKLDTVTTGCGGSTDVISSPGFPSLYPNNSECVWEMTVEPGYHIGLSFIDRFNLETSVNCTNDYVQVFDRENEDTDSWRSLGRVCGRNVPTPINSTSNHMKVIFRSNEAVRGDGFRAVFEKNCGGIFAATNYRQFIESPDYPSFYARDLNCNYTIIAPAGKMILLEFEEFEVEGPSPSCKYDNLTIHTDYYWMKEVSTFCGSNKPPVHWSMDKTTIIFKTDQYVQRRGFKLKYFLSDCGGEISEEEILEPPISVDAEYFGRLNCTWIIKAPADKSIALRFQSFELEYSRICFGDRVMVFEGHLINRTNIRATLCGNLTESLPIVKSIGNEMTVNFISDPSNHFKGFKAKILFTKSIASGCGGEINLTRTQTWRTQREDNYENYEDCMWIVTTGQSKNIKITFNNFDVKNSGNKTILSQNSPCNGDFLEIRDGRGPYAELIGRYCGSSLPTPITSTRNILWMRFYSDDTSTGTGVRATLEAIDSPCGESLIKVTNTTKIIKSPNYPGDFPLGLQCKWILEGTPGRDLHIHLKDINMEDERNCGGDRLQLTDKRVNKDINQDFGENFIITGLGERRVTLIGSITSLGSYTFCGKVDLYDYYSGGHEVEVALKTTENNPTKSRKFELEISIANCTRNYTSSQGRINNQGFKNCWITITVPQGHTISLYFLSLRIFDSAKCPNSYLKIYDGNFNSPSLGTFCGMTVPSPIFSTGNQLSLMSNSHRGVTWENYDIIYTSTDKGRGCGGKIYNYAGTFTSPMYPSNYRVASVCQWDISVPRGLKVVLEFSFFDLGSGETCTTDYVEIKDEASSMSTIVRYCGGERPARFKSNSNDVALIYASSVNNGGTGWVINFVGVQESFDDSASGPIIAPFSGFPPRIID